MPRILYRAIDPAGLPVEDVVDAVSAREAVAMLGERGFICVQLLGAPLDAGLRDGATPVLEGRAADDVARLQAAVRRPGYGLWSVWRQVLRGARWWLALAALMAAYGLWVRSGFLAILGIAMLGLPFVLSGLSYRHAARYEAYLRAAAFGRREEMARLAQLLGRAVADPAMRFDLAMREAEFVAREQGIEAAMAQVEPLREALDLDQRASGLFSARAALLHLAAGDAAGFVQGMRDAWEESGRDSSRALDAALAEARCGNPDNARALLADIDAASLPVMAASFHAWTRALLQEQAGEDGREAFSRALGGFSEHARLSAVWSALATCTCDYALALARHGQPSQGRALVDTVWPVARVHLDGPTRHLIQHTFFAGQAPAASER
ncbi:hypothetical protein OS176_10435 [Xanthomonadaceae bacterium XH05]|nr:hypothetical protein [Xanthomonadaceae bacterium XH05]